MFLIFSIVDKAAKHDDTFLVTWSVHLRFSWIYTPRNLGGDDSSTGLNLAWKFKIYICVHLLINVENSRRQKNGER